MSAGTGRAFEGLTVFIGGPFSSALVFEDGKIVGFDENLRAQFDRVHNFFLQRGAKILSSHLAESYGQEVHEGTLVQRDNSWLRASDLYVAFLPMRGAEPYRTDGTFVEIGLAIGAHKPCGLIVEASASPAWSYYVRNLGQEKSVIISRFEDGESAWADAFAPIAARSRNASEKLGAHVTAGDVLASLIMGSPDGHTVRVGRAMAHLPSNVTSSRYDLSLRMLCSMVDERQLSGTRVLVANSDTLEAGAHAIAAGAAEVVALTNSNAERAASMTSLQEFAALTNSTSSIRAMLIEQVSQQEKFDVILCHIRVMEGRDQVAGELKRALSAASRLLSSAGSLFVSTAAPGSHGDIHALLRDSGLALRNDRHEVWDQDSTVTFSLWEACVAPAGRS